MLLDLLRQLNWLDILIIILLFRICYIALKSGLPAEIFKLLGTLSSIYISLHYYTALSDFIRGRFALDKKMPLEFLDFLSFLSLAVASYLFFVLLRSVFYRFIKLEAVDRLNKWGGFVLGIGRGILLSGLIIFILVISSISYLKQSVKSSYLGPCFFKVAPNTYNWLWNNLTSKFMAQEKFNKTVLEAQESFFKK